MKLFNSKIEIVVLFLLLLFPVLGYGYFAYSEKQNAAVREAEQEQERIRQANGPRYYDIYDDEYSPSMVPTISATPKKMRFEKREAAIGDIIHFHCKTTKCSGNVVHRLTKIEPNGCMHIEGDNQPIAHDTRDYGCLMPDEIEIMGVMISWEEYDPKNNSK